LRARRETVKRPGTGGKNAQGGCGETGGWEGGGGGVVCVWCICWGGGVTGGGGLGVFWGGGVLGGVVLGWGFVWDWDLGRRGGVPNSRSSSFDGIPPFDSC